jgi:hypothetical protein
MTSLEWWRNRQPGLTVTLPDFPSLDEALLHWLLARSAWPSALEALCLYAEDVRQGRWPDRVAPESCVQSVYLAIAQEQLIGAKSRDGFLRDVTVLFDAAAAHLEKGSSLVDEPFVQVVPALQRYVSGLRDDRRLFADDLARSKTLQLTFPPQASLSGAPRSLRCLVLDRPTATQFKLWARSDGDAAVLLVRQADGMVVLSADPAKKLKLAWLAPFMAAREGAQWYDGARHEGTLIASPKSGSKLSLDEIVAELGKHAPIARKKLPLGWLAAGAAGVVIVAAMIVIPPPSRPLDVVIHDAVKPPEPTPSGAKGDPIPRAKVFDLLASADGPRSFEPYALVAGVCGYTGAHELKAPCRDARAVRDLLIHTLGYKPANVLFFIDRPQPGEAVDGPPTAAAMKLAVERFRERTHADETSSFLFYYSGHGGYEKGARKDFGVLQPAGYFDDEAAPISQRGWDMQELLDDLRKGVPSKHVMVVLDACYSGWAVGAKGEETLSPELKSLWAERAEVVLTAGTKGQRAWEDEAEPTAWQWGGHSALTAFLLAGLGADGRLEADSNGDRVVTDEELAAYVRHRVSTAVEVQRHAQQTPQFFRFDEQLPKSGQFLFLSGATP